MSFGFELYKINNTNTLDPLIIYGPFKLSVDSQNHLDFLKFE